MSRSRQPGDPNAPQKPGVPGILLVLLPFVLVVLLVAGSLPYLLSTPGMDAMGSMAPMQGMEAAGGWSDATAAGAGEAAVFLTIANHGAADRLVSADTPVAARAKLERMVMDGATMRMQPLDELPIGSGRTIALAPAGDRIVLTGLKQPLRRGQGFPLTLHFRQAGSLDVAVHVGAPDATGSGNNQAMTMPMAR